MEEANAMQLKSIASSPRISTQTADVRIRLKYRIKCRRLLIEFSSIFDEFFLHKIVRKTNNMD